MSTEPKMPISILLTPMPHGSEDSMKTPMTLSVSTFPRAMISPISPPVKFRPLWMNSPNNRRRKCLGVNTPNQVFFNIDPIVAFGSWIHVPLVRHVARYMLLDIARLARHTREPPHDSREIFHNLYRLNWDLIYLTPSHAQDPYK